MSGQQPAFQARRLTGEELGQLAIAAKWGLLRDLAGMRVCLAGNTSIEQPQFAYLIEVAGGIFTDVVTDSTDMLVCSGGRPATGEEKRRLASELRVPAISEADFVLLLTPSVEELEAGYRARFGGGAWPRQAEETE